MLLRQILHIFIPPTTRPWPLSSVHVSVIRLLHSSSPLLSTVKYGACQCFLSHWKLSKPTPLIGLQVPIEWVAPTASVVTIWGLSPNHLRPEVLHYGPRAVCLCREANHCQQHISVCLGAERSEGFPRSFGKLLPNVDRYQKVCSRARTGTCTDSCYKLQFTSVWLVVEASQWAEPCLFFSHRQVSWLVNFHYMGGFVVEKPQSFIRDSHRHSLSLPFASLSSRLFY